MNKNTKIYILVIAIMVIVICGILYATFKSGTPGSLINEEDAYYAKETLLSDETIPYLFHDYVMTTGKISFKVKNISEQDLNASKWEIALNDENGNALVTKQFDVEALKSEEETAILLEIDSSIKEYAAVSISPVVQQTIHYTTTESNI